MSTNFGERYGLDRVALANVQSRPGLSLVEHDVAQDSGLPFEDGFFDVVTMLAVFEHLETPTLNRLLLEVRRVLRLGGVYVMTTPTRWTEGLLKTMASLKLVSHEEVGEHKAQYSRREVVSLLLKAGFDPSQISHGTFELGMNVWAVAAKGI